MERGAFMSKQEWIEQFAKSWVEFCQNLLEEIETEKEKVDGKLRTIEQERQEEIEQRKELDEAFKFALETLGTEVRAIQDELSEAKQAFITERNKRKELGQVFIKFRDKQVVEHTQLSQDVENLQEENKSLKQGLQGVIKSLEELKQENIRLRQENANLRELEANWNKHINDDIRHIKRVTGPTPQSQAKASEVNHQRAEDTNIKVFRAIFGYLQNAQDKSKVDMSWLLKTTGLSESTIRQTVKELQEHKLDNHIKKQANGTYTFYGLSVPMAFIQWQQKGNFFNVPR